MEAIKTFTDEHGLYLFEDCSHAHLATYKGSRVGTFGDAAVWSLQGQKNITGGEGGILVTSNEDIYIRATLHGHYNKRSKQVIPEDHPLYRFALTGMGLKMRSHPLAVAFATLQLKHHDEYQAVRNDCAAAYDELFADYSFIHPVEHSETEPSWYGYVFRYDEVLAGMNRESFVELLQAEGLREVDIPGSTTPNHLLPLFQEPHVLFPQFYEASESFNTSADFPQALEFYGTVVKLPTWTLNEHKELLNYYLEGLRKVCAYVAGAK